MNQIETGTGRTIDEAVNDALTRMALTRDDVEITVLQQPENGFLGFGRKDAVVEVRKINRAADRAEAFLNDVFAAMGLTCTVETEEADGFLKIALSGDKMGVLIGRRGQTLDALQYLTSLAVNRGEEDYTRVLLDTENYRAKRAKTLEALGEKMAGKALRYHKKISLEPMNAAERRIIHAHLQEDSRVTTYSEGQDPYRHIIIKPANLS